MKEKKSGSKPFGIILLIIAILCLGVGLTLNYLSNPKRVLNRMYSSLSTALTKTLTNRLESVGNFENYTLDATMKMDISSPTMEAAAAASPEIYGNYVKQMKLISSLTTSITFATDTSNERLFLNTNVNIGDTSLLHVKYLIDNATEYYYLENYTPAYVNNGNKTYFESLNNDTTSTDNLTYLMDYTIKSAINSLEDDDFKKSTVEMTINGTKDKYLKTSLKINQKKMLDIEKKVLKSLKSDSKASQILTGLFPEFSKTKVTNSDNLLSAGEELTLNVYTDKFGLSIKKYEVVNTLDDSTASYVYEPTSDTEGTFYIIDNNQIMEKIIYTGKDNDMTFKILTSTDEEIGKIDISLKDTSTKIEYTAKSESGTQSASYTSTLSDIKKNDSYSEKIEISYHEATYESEILNFNLTLDSTVSSKVKIEEDVSNSILSSTLTDEDKEKLTNVLSNIILKLEG